MFIDSHCHLDFPLLRDQLPKVLLRMQLAQVSHALCISTTLEGFPQVLSIAQSQNNLWATAGVHPDEEGVSEPSIETLVQLATDPNVVAIGETGLDYYDMQGRKGGRTIADMVWQRERYRVHLRAAKSTCLPLVIHTREASSDTLAILHEEGAAQGHLRGVFHCFTETKEVAKAALEMGFYISFSGILTFKAAQELREVAAYVPLDRCLIETDSPYLAPSPHRGKTNEPSYVPFVAKQLAELKGLSVEEIAQATTDNFFNLFNKARQNHAH